MQNHVLYTCLQALEEKIRQLLARYTAQQTAIQKLTAENKQLRAMVGNNHREHEKECIEPSQSSKSTIDYCIRSIDQCIADLEQQS